MTKTEGYTFLLWNKRYGKNANFIVRDNASGKFSLFSPMRSDDLVWVTDDLTQNSEYDGWEDFGNETVENLKEVVF